MPTAKCFWRYNNSGGRYKVCIDKTNKNAPDEVWDTSKRKWTGTPTEYITPAKFVEQKFHEYKGAGKIPDDWTLSDFGYSDMKKPSERREYHRLDMGIRRRNERLDLKKATKDIEKHKKKLTEERRKESKELKKIKAGGMKIAGINPSGVPYIITKSGKVKELLALKGAVSRGELGPIGGVPVPAGLASGTIGSTNIPVSLEFG
tara:strand:+ start:1211 stop:1822 length:612 start_codon:yes stop_codon:yes gene_type:complete